MLRVVDGTTGDPLPGAQVWWASIHEITRFRESSRGATHWSDPAILEQIGNKEFADSSGHIGMQGKPSIGVLFTGRHGELSGTGLRNLSEFGSLDKAEKAELEYAMPASEDLELFPDRTLEVRVVDSRGQSQGNVAVSLRLERGEQEKEVWRGKTSREDGIARIEHVDRLLPDFYRARRSGRSVEVYADFGFVTYPSAAVRIDASPWPATAVQLTLPDTGSLTVTVFDENWQPTTERAMVYVAVAELSDPSLPTIGEGDIEGGSIRFGSIPLGLNLVVHVSFYGMRGSIRREIRGPDGYRSDVELVLHQSAPTPLITGRLLDDLGQPIRSRAARFYWAAHNDRGNSFAGGNQVLATNVDGRFEARLGTAPYPGGSYSIRLSCEGSYAERELTADYVFEHNELGNLRLDREQEEPPARSR